MPLHIHLKRKIKNQDKFETLVDLSGIDFIQDFYKQRGLKENQDNKTNGISIRVLRNDLFQACGEAIDNNNTTLAVSLRAAHDSLSEVIQGIKKGDELYVYYGVESQVSHV